MLNIRHSILIGLIIICTPYAFASGFIFKQVTDQSNPSDRQAFRNEFMLTRDMDQSKWGTLGSLGGQLALWAYDGSDYQWHIGIRPKMSVTLSYDQFPHFHVNTFDGQFGLFSTLDVSSLHVQAGVDHWSGHFVDGIASKLINNKPIFSYEDIKLLVSYQIHPSLSFFVKASQLISNQSTESKERPTSFSMGTTIYPYTLKAFRPLLSIHLGVNGFHPTVMERSALIGLDLLGKGNVGLLYFNGFRRQGMFSTQRTEQLSLVLRLPWG